MYNQVVNRQNGKLFIIYTKTDHDQIKSQNDTSLLTLIIVNLEGWKKVSNATN